MDRSATPRLSQDYKACQAPPGLARDGPGGTLSAVVAVFRICGSYSQISAAFPSGGGGYIVASKFLGEKAGVVSGSALVIDYVLTVTISRAARVGAILRFLPP